MSTSGSSGGRPNILPSYQANLTRRLDELYIARVCMDRDPKALWTLLDAFVDSSPREIKKELSDGKEQMRKEIKSFLKIIGTTEEDKVRKIRITENNYLLGGDEPLRTLYVKIIDTLDEKGYLIQVRGYGDIPKSGMNL